LFLDAMCAYPKVAPYELDFSKVPNTNEPKSKYKIGELIKVRCQLGYSPVGFQTRFCQRNGTWSGHALKCNRKEDL